MKVTEKGSYLIITSYPLKLAWLCLLIIFSSLYAGILQLINQIPVLLGVTVPTVFLFIFDFKLTIFDFNNHEMLQTNYSIRGKRALTLPFRDIDDIDGDCNENSLSNTRCVRVITRHNHYDVTAISDASCTEQSRLVLQLKQSLGLT